VFKGLTSRIWAGLNELETYFRSYLTVDDMHRNTILSREKRYRFKLYL